MPLISSEHFPVWMALQISVWVRLCNLASSFMCSFLLGYLWSMNQSSKLKESCPLNVGISLSMIMVRFDSLCVASREVCACLHGFVHWSSLDLGAGWNTIVKCCSLSVSHDHSSVGVDCRVVDLKLANWLLHC